MSANFQLEYKKCNGNLYVNPKGDLDGSSAWELANLLHEQYDGKGWIFIDTVALDGICPFGCTTFQLCLNRRLLPFAQICFKGAKGHALAPEGTVVIGSKKVRQCNCSVPCRNCRCRRQDDQ